MLQDNFHCVRVALCRYQNDRIGAVLLIGLPIAVVVCREVSRRSFAGEIVPYQFPILEMGLFLLVLFGLEFLLSAWTAGRQRKQSLVEQMRAVE